MSESDEERRDEPVGTRAAKPGARGGPRLAESVLPERYEALDVIGRGGWGEILRVRDRVMDRAVAMKVLSAEHLDSPQTLGRFLNEATTTSFLAHPGVVPVHDRGVLPDGRPWFTMKEVRGRTLAAILREERHGQLSDPARVRRMADVFARICETVGFAHERGVVHRDLKPANVMIGELGEVLVLDWGIARRRGERASGEIGSADTPAGQTQVGDVLGTAPYMSPEQARGANERVDPRSDVFALGLVLFEMLTCRPARDSDRIHAWMAAANAAVPEIDDELRSVIPDELVAVYRRAVEAEPDDRFADGRALAEAMRAFLDGAARRERAVRVVGVADAMAPRIAALRTEQAALAARARAMLVGVSPHDPAEKKIPAWRLEDDAKRVEQEAELAEASHVETLLLALEHDPEHRDAHARLAAIYRARVLDAEARGDGAEAARAERSLRKHDRGEHARFLAGLGFLAIDSEPSGARVRISRYEPVDRRLVLVDTAHAGRTPFERELPAGSYLVTLEHEGFAPARVPVRIVRDAAWDATRPGDVRPTPVRLLRELGDDEAYVPAGWVEVGGDPLALEPVPLGRVWIDGFVMQRCAVTWGAYLEMLDALWDAGDEEGALRAAPRWPRDTSTEMQLAAERSGGRFVMRLDPAQRDEPATPDLPITLIDWHMASAFARWLGERSGLPWRLPNELEWEKAACGADRRPYPWGTQPEPTWARMLGATAQTPCPVRVGSYPFDESPYGVRDVAGNTRTWCANEWSHEGPARSEEILVVFPRPPRAGELISIRGGSFGSVPAHARGGGRFASAPVARFSAVGVRLVRSV